MLTANQARMQSDFSRYYNQIIKQLEHAIEKAIEEGEFECIVEIPQVVPHHSCVFNRVCATLTDKGYEFHVRKSGDRREGTVLYVYYISWSRSIVDYTPRNTNHDKKHIRTT